MAEKKYENTAANETEEQIELNEQTEQTEQQEAGSDRRSGTDRRGFALPYEGVNKRKGRDRRRKNQPEQRDSY